MDEKGYEEFSGTVQSVPWAVRERYGPEACFEIRGPDKRNSRTSDRLVIAFLKHDGIFHARPIDREVSAKVREAYQ